MKQTQKGFTPVSVIVVVLIIVISGFVGLRVYHSYYSGSSVKKHLSLMKLSFWYPKTWQVISNGEGVNSGYFELKSSDGFELGFLDAKGSFFSGGRDGATKSTASEATKIDNIGSMVISADEGTGKFNSITVVSNSPKVGDAFYPDDIKYLPSNPKIKDVYVQINGGFIDKSYDSLSEFDNQTSVKQSKQILQSLKYY